MAITIDEALSQIGGFGRYQYVYVTITGFLHLVMSTGSMMDAFLVGEPTWECIQNSTACNFTSPITTVSKYYSVRCGMPRNSWKFSNKYTSVVTEYELICERSILQGVISSVYWIGWPLGNIIVGYTSDKFGRKKSAFWSLIVFVVVSWIIIWPKSLFLFAVGRMIMGLTKGGCTMCLYVLTIENSPVKQRAISSICYFMFGASGLVVLPLIAYLCRDWRGLLTINAIMSSSCLFLLWFLPASPRYFLVNKKHDKARNLLEYIARINKKEMPKDTLEVPTKIKDEKPGLAALFYNIKMAKITLINWFTWLSANIVYYSWSYASVYLGGYIYLNFLLAVAIQVPSNLTMLYATKRYGRKFVTIFGLVGSAVACVGSIITPADRHNTGYTTLRITLMTLGQFLTTLSFNTLYIWSAETFPTSIRNTGLGTSSGVGKIGTFLSLYVVWLDRVHPALQYIITGLLCLTSAIACSTLQETKSIPTREGLSFVKKQDNFVPDPKENITERRDTDYYQNKQYLGSLYLNNLI